MGTFQGKLYQNVCALTRGVAKRYKIVSLLRYFKLAKV